MFAHSATRSLQDSRNSLTEAEESRNSKINIKSISSALNDAQNTGKYPGIFLLMPNIFKLKTVMPLAIVSCWIIAVFDLYKNQKFLLILTKK